MSAAALLLLDDLQAVFEALPEEQLRAMEGSFPKGASGVGYMDNNRSQMVMGLIFPVTTRAEQATYDESLPQLIKLFGTGIGANANPKQLSGLNDIGEVRSGNTMVSKMGSLSMRWGIVAFRRGKAVAFLIDAYPNGDKPAIPIHDLAQLLDERISKFFASNP